jgi:hypothetical protein
MKKHLILSALAILAAVSMAAAQSSDSFTTSIDRSLRVSQPTPTITIPDGRNLQAVIRQGCHCKCQLQWRSRNTELGGKHVTHDPKDPQAERLSFRVDALSPLKSTRRMAAAQIFGALGNRVHPSAARSVERSQSLGENRPSN